MYHIIFIFLSLIAMPLMAAPDPDKLDLASVSVLIKDLDTQEVLYERLPDRVQPVASLTKLMTGLVTLDGRLPMRERINVAVKEIPTMRNVVSRIPIGSNLPRQDVLHIALMSSENRAAATLAHAYPGGAKQFIENMNLTAQGLSMTNTHFHEPTGLSSKNVSTASDLMRLLEAANLYPSMSQFTTSSKRDVIVKRPRRAMAFFNTNSLVNKNAWTIRLSKTGYTDDAGRCLVLAAHINRRNIGIVLLDSYGKKTHLADAQRVKRWLETGSSGKVPKGASRYRDQKLNTMTTAAR